VKRIQTPNLCKRRQGWGTQPLALTKRRKGDARRASFAKTAKHAAPTGAGIALEQSRVRFEGPQPEVRENRSEVPRFASSTLAGSRKPARDDNLKAKATGKPHRQECLCHLGQKQRWLKPSATFRDGNVRQRQNTVLRGLGRLEAAATKYTLRKERKCKWDTVIDAGGSRLEAGKKLFSGGI
jgi:hypothetical protein